MKLIIEETTEKMSESALQIVLGEMMQDKQVNISLTSGRSPEKMYEMMVPAIKGKAKYKDVQYWLFDENPYDGDEYGPNWYDMQKMIFGPAEIEDERVHHLTRENYTEYDEQVRRAGGIDVMVIVLGWDGHFCGNCPRCTPFDSLTYRFLYTDKQKLNPTYKDRPTQPYTYTMGPQSLMRVRRLVMIVNGSEKAEILKRFIEEPINEDVPATILKLHPNLTVIADQDAAALLNPEGYENI